MSRPSWIGQTLGGRYRIDDILGQGGMSAVYKAYDPNLKRVVAVKMIHAHLADDPKFIIRFEEEAAAVAQLRHPNIVQVFDFNHDNDLYYMVQEFVAGETLQQRLRRFTKSGRQMAVNEAIGYILNICDATGYAHKRGLIHRDIKPANIMIDIHGQAILMDFGIVKITGGEKHTATGAVIGTALYLPPELIRGEAPDPRSDLYSLAVTLFEAVSGRPPFEADSAMTLMMMHLNDPLPDLRQIRPDIPPSLAVIIEKAMAKNREQRHASMDEFANVLRSVLGEGAAPIAATLAEQPVSSEIRPVVESTAPMPQGPASTNHYVATLIGSKPAETADATPQTPPKPQTSTSGTVPAAAEHSADSAAISQPGLPAPKPNQNWLLYGGISGAVVIILIVIYFLTRGSLGTAPPAVPTVTIALSATQLVEAAVPTLEPSPTSSPTPEATLPPTSTPTITPSPTPTIPAGVPYSRINGITIGPQGNYVVDYETFEYTENLPGQHVHFFFDTVLPEQAGNPGKGPWKLYGGPRPFTEYNPANRPALATQMCVLVANANHTVILNSGNCYILPDVNVAVPIFDDPCLAGPGSAYPTLSQLRAGQRLLVTGISPDEAWWTVANPADTAQSCWLQRSRSDFSGDLSTLALAEVPPAPEGSAANLVVQISAITLDAQNRYVVDFTTSGYTPALPGTHIHFFFDIFTNDILNGVSGNILMYGGASPFTGYSQVDKPAGSTQLCALVANPNHTVLAGSGNCMPLP